jgi:hypothetical protein
MFSYFTGEKPVIEFYCRPEYEGILPEPVPAYKRIPDWWKKLSNYTDNLKKDAYGSKIMTAKKCMPLFDAMSIGYIIPLQADVNIVTNSDLSIIEASGPGELKVLEFHDIKQVGGRDAPCYPAKPVKFINYWIVKTAPGWSTLFLPLINRINEPFTCMSGLVDTDTYKKEVNFPAVWNTPNFDEKLPAGTPLVVAIPVKRKVYEEKPKIRKMTDKEVKEINKMDKIQRSRSSYYTNELRDSRK